MKRVLIFLATASLVGALGLASAEPLPQLAPKMIPVPAEGWDSFFNDCSWYCGAPVIKVSASSFLTESSGLKHPPGQSHDGQIGKAWSEGAKGTGVGESLTYTFLTTEEDTTDLGVTTCAIAIGHQASRDLFKKNARPKTIELSIDGAPKAVLNLKDTMGLQEFTIPKLALERPSKHTITLKILEIYPGTRHKDTCIAEVYFQGTGRMH